jgi:hypothetical protein
MLEPVLTSLVDALAYRLKHHIDVILFNPPYVPTDEDEAQEAQSLQGIAGAWAGGLYGMRLTNVLLERISVSPIHSGLAGFDLYLHRSCCLLRVVSTSSPSSRTTYPKYKNVCMKIMACSHE